MDALGEQLDSIKSRIYEIPYFQDCVEHLKKGSLVAYKEIEPSLNKIKKLTPEEVIDDFSNLRVNAVTVSIGFVSTVAVFLLLSAVGGNKKAGGKNDKINKKKPKKKITKSQKANKEIQAILDFVEDEYVPQIDEYLQNYRSLKKEDVEYKYNYFEEMLLKELMKLDGIEVVGNDILRENRKKVIKFIQDHQKRLDKFKKEVAF